LIDGVFAQKQTKRTENGPLRLSHSLWRLLRKSAFGALPAGQPAL